MTSKWQINTRVIFTWYIIQTLYMYIHSYLYFQSTESVSCSSDIPISAVAKPANLQSRPEPILHLRRPKTDEQIFIPNPKSASQIGHIYPPIAAYRLALAIWMTDTISRHEDPVLARRCSLPFPSLVIRQRTAHFLAPPATLTGTPISRSCQSNNATTRLLTHPLRASHVPVSHDTASP